MRSLRTLMAVVCVLLVLFAGTVQAVHSHIGCPDPHANCSLCVTAHVAIQLTQSPAPAAGARIVARVEALPPAQLPSAFSAFSHFTRPPPALGLPA